MVSSLGTHELPTPPDTDWQLCVYTVYEQKAVNQARAAALSARFQEMKAAAWKVVSRTLLEPGSQGI